MLHLQCSLRAATHHSHVHILQGFENWSKRDFISFYKACEKFGRKNVVEIAAEIEGKTLVEIKEYSKIFWKRYTEIAGALIYCRCYRRSVVLFFISQPAS